MNRARSIDEVLDHIRGTIEDVSLGQVAAERIHPTDRILGDLGLDSLDYATVLLETEDWLGVRVQEDEVDWETLATVEQLAAFLWRRAAA